MDLRIVGQGGNEGPRSAGSWPDRRGRRDTAGAKSSARTFCPASPAWGPPLFPSFFSPLIDLARGPRAALGIPPLNPPSLVLRLCPHPLPGFRSLTDTYCLGGCIPQAPCDLPTSGRSHCQRSWLPFPLPTSCSCFWFGPLSGNPWFPLVKRFVLPHCPTRWDPSRKTGQNA